MPARSAGITKWTKSAVFEKVTADRVSPGKTLLPEKISMGVLDFLPICSGITGLCPF